MTNPFVSGVGHTLSADIAAPEHERELRFYSRVLATGDLPMWREKTLLNNLGLPVIGLGERKEAHAALPLQWMPHIQVADVAASVERALARGGRELMHGKDKDGRSQWAVLSDPNGAAFGLIPVVPPEMIPTMASDGTGDTPAAVGRIAWLDLTVPNAIATRDFYGDVVGWGVQELEMKDGEERYADYVMLASDGKPAAGVCHARGANVGLPPVWLIYLPVGDIEASLERVEQEGGAILKSHRGKDGKYVYAAIRDAVGACVALAPA